MTNNNIRFNQWYLQIERSVFQDFSSIWNMIIRRIFHMIMRKFESSNPDLQSFENEVLYIYGIWIYQTRNIKHNTAEDYMKYTNNILKKANQPSDCESAPVAVPRIFTKPTLKIWLSSRKEKMTSIPEAKFIPEEKCIPSKIYTKENLYQKKKLCSCEMLMKGITAIPTHGQWWSDSNRNATDILSKEQGSDQY